MNNPKYKGLNTGEGPSPALWNKLNVLDAIDDPNLGYQWFDDFMGFQDPTTAKAYGPYLCLDTGDSVLAGVAARGGAMSLLVTTDNEDAGIRLGDATSGAFVISDTAGDNKTLYFEARVKRSVVANGKGSVFVGLTEAGALAANFIADAANDFADKGLIGFWLDEADGDNVKFVYQKSGQDFVTKIAALAATAADTYIKLGFKYDPSKPPTERITVFVNNVPSTTKVTATDIAAATFPDGVVMNPTFYASAGSADDFLATIDWWWTFQER